MVKLDRDELIRLVGLNIAVLLESLAVLSVILETALLPLGQAYPNVVSVLVFVLPSVVGLLSRRFEAAILLAVLPFWLLSIIYLAVYAPIWNVDLFTLGVFAGRAAGATVLLGSLAFIGWLVRRALWGRKAIATHIH